MDNRNTRRSGKIQFEIDVPHLSVHQNSPYFIGVQAWNYMLKLLQDIDKKIPIQRKVKGVGNKLCIKKSQISIENTLSFHSSFVVTGNICIHVRYLFVYLSFTM